MAMHYMILVCFKTAECKINHVMMCRDAIDNSLLCVCIFLHFKEKTQPEHKEFRGLKAPKKRWIQAWDSW